VDVQTRDFCGCKSLPSLRSSLNSAVSGILLDLFAGFLNARDIVLVIAYIDLLNHFL
jgi:hypothetical protein